MTLSQYYDKKIKELGFNSWNHYCAQALEHERDRLKKTWKKEFKNLFPKPGYINDPKEIL